MNRREQARDITAATDLGVSFSLVSCNDYQIDWKKALAATLDLGFRRFRMMSYWSIHEKKEGVYDFSALDTQLAMVKKAGGRVTLAIGMRQPRWPETHIPQWAKELPKEEAEKRYLAFHHAVIERYKGHEVIESWQLENEFWLRNFGESFDFSRTRLKKEFAMIRELNPERPIIMSVSSFLSLPLRSPKPDIYATSMYRVTYNQKKGYTKTWIWPYFYRIKRLLIRLLRWRDFIVHELQAEPWGPRQNWDMSTEEQFKSIDKNQIPAAVAYARASGITYTDLWGAEWWYWRQVKYNDTALSKTVASLTHDATQDIA